MKAKTFKDFTKDEINDLIKTYNDCAQIVKDGDEELKEYFKERKKK